MTEKKPFLFVLGTRPEGIKLLPLVWEIQKRGLPFELLHTRQHTDLLDTLLEKHKFFPNYRLSPHPAELVAAKCSILSQMEERLDADRFSALIVQGDTLSALCGAEYGFFHRTPVVHIEAGMRTYRKDNPYPEEILRRMISAMAELHFCPSEDEANSLRREGIPPDRVFVTGNTFPDYWQSLPKPTVPPKKQILVTIHRRENLPFLERIFDAIAELARELCELELLFPLHPNPTIIECAKARLSGIPNLRLTKALPPEAFYRELCASELVFTDSGGVQEECIFLGKKVLVVRKISERRADFPFSTLVDPEEGDLVKEFLTLRQKQVPNTPCDYYGRGGASAKIAEVLAREI